MSTSEKPGFLSKLFGRAVSRPSDPPENIPSSSSDGGSSSSVEEHTEVNGSSSPAASKPLRYLSPTAIESSFARVSTRPSESIADVVRKRPLGSPQATSSLTNGSFYISDNAKRFRGNANMSFTAEPVSRLELPKLDTTWTAGMALGSPSNRSYSPCSSVRSMRSRITRPSSRTSVLSSKTAALLGQIERVSTPAQDARRMPMLRVGLNKERWSSNSLGSSSTNNPPPLTRLSSVPSRYQMMSTFLSPMQKKPYWRDVARERPEEVREESRIAPESALTLPSTTRTSNGEKNGKSEPPARAAHQPVLKGSDGQNLSRGRNTFSANEISHEESADLEALSSVSGLNEYQFKFAVPAKGLLNDVKPSFSFKKPIKVTEMIEESESSEGESEESESSESGSGDDEQDGQKEKATEKTSDTSSSAENTSKETSNEETKKVSPPRNSVAASSFNIKPATESQKPSLPVVASKKWDCSTCCISNDESVSACIACSTPKAGAAAAPPPLSSFSSVSTPQGSWNCTECFVSNKPTDVKCVACSNPKPGAAPPAPSSSANWNCSTCFVSNKAVDAKCSCCGEINPNAPSTSAPSAASSNVFGANAFKPAAAPSGIKFGFGVGTSSSTPAVPSPLTFGAKPSTETASKPTTTGFVFGAKPSTESTAPSLVPSITVTAPPSAPTTNTPAVQPLFGASSSTSTTGGFSFGVKPPATNGETKNTLAAPTLPAAAPAAPAAPMPSALPAFNLAPVTSSGLSSTSGLFSSSAPSSNLFGSSTAVSSAPSLFGSSSTSAAPISSTPLFGSISTSAAPSISSTPLFGSTSTAAAPAVSSTPLFGSSSTPLFGSSAPSNATPSVPVFGAAAAPAANASTLAAPSLSFGFGGAKTEAPKMPMFGSTESKPLFGGPKEDEGPGAKKAMFGTSSANPFGSFGQSANTGTANLFGSGSLTQSTSAPSFSAPTAPSSTFNFGSQPVSTAPPPTVFSFGAPSAAAPSTSAAPFVFGQQAPPAGAPSFGAPSLPSFGAPSANIFPPSAPVDGANPFAFNAGASSGARKMISAKRRLGGKK